MSKILFVEYIIQNVIRNMSLLSFCITYWIDRKSAVYFSFSGYKLTVSWNKIWVTARVGRVTNGLISQLNTEISFRWETCSAVTDSVWYSYCVALDRLIRIKRRSSHLFRYADAMCMSIMRPAAGSSALRRKRIGSANLKSVNRSGGCIEIFHQ